MALAHSAATPKNSAAGYVRARSRECRPQRELDGAAADQVAGADSERRPSDDEQQRAAEKDARARLVESPPEYRERWHRERGQPTDGELAEHEKEAVAEIGHLRTRRRPS